MAPKKQTQLNTASANTANLKTESDLAAAVAALGKQCHIMRAIAKRSGRPPLREFPADFAGLAKIVTGQQVSAASAAAIWGRVDAGIRPFEAFRLLQCSEAELKSLGLSSGKCRTLRAVAEAVAKGDLNFASLNRADDDAIRSQLTALHGIGPWTADIYLLFALKRADAFPPGDLALQIAAQRLFNLNERPSPLQLLEIAERWRPWRGAAARLLWADYAYVQRAKKAETPKKRASTA